MVAGCLEDLTKQPFFIVLWVSASLHCRKTLSKCRKHSFQSTAENDMLVLWKEWIFVPDSWRVPPAIFEAAMYGYTAFCITARRREGEKKQETFNLWPLSLFFFCSGLLFALLSAIFSDAGELTIFTLPIAFASLFLFKQPCSLGSARILVQNRFQKRAPL